MKDIHNLIGLIVLFSVNICQSVVAKAFEIAAMVLILVRFCSNLLKSCISPIDQIYNQEENVGHCEGAEVAIEQALDQADD